MNGSCGKVAGVDGLALARSARTALALAAVAVVFFFAAQAQATLYEVGPGKPYTEINQVPWENIAAGDTVNIYWRSTPYKSKWVITAAGTQSQPILIHGVPDGTGALPVIDGNAATTRLELSYWNDERGIINFGHSSIPADGIPKYVTIENLEIKDARPPYQYTCDEGTLKSYPNNAAGIWVVVGENITVRNCIFDNNGNGFFTYSDDTYQSRNILVEGCYLYDNGNDASIYEHNSYCESLGITYQYNHYGPLRTNCPGNNLKDRSAGMIVRYNWIENGNRQLDLVDAEDSGVLGTDPSYAKAFVYGNYLVEGMSGNRQVVHFGGDMGGMYRKNGYFYNNTVVSTRTDATTFFRASGGAQSVVDCRNNIIYVTAAGSTMEISNDSDGIVNMTHNWLKPGYLLAGGSGGTVHDDGTSVTGASPGFTNEGAQDYTLAAGSACINAGTTLHADCLPDNGVYYQYVKHQGHEARPNDGQIDIGANERAGGGIADLVITTASLPNGQVTVAYSQAVVATGGQYPYTWSISSGSLPNGLSIASSTGIISGTPTTAATSNFTVRVQDSQGTPDVATKALSITVALLPIQITGPSFTRNAQQNVHYSQQLSAGQGQAPYTWSVSSGTLPAGLTLTPSTGVISGSPTTIGASNFTIRVQDSQTSPDSTTKAYAISVVAASGATYWVAASGGSDGNTGAWDHPWATIQYAINTVPNGGTVLVGPGTFTGFRITNSGASGSPKTVMSETVGAAVLNAAVAGNAYGADVEVEGASGAPVSYWIVDGFKIDGVSKNHRCVYFNYTSHVSLKNNEALQSSSTGIFARYSDYLLAENNESTGHAGTGIFAQSSTDNGTIRGNNIHDNTSSGIKINGYSYDAGDGLMSNWLVEKNTVANCVSGCDLDGVENSSFKNNLIYSVSSKGFSMVAIDGNTVPRNNRVLNNTVLNKTTGYYNVFIFNEYAKPAGVGNAFYNNILYNYNTAVNRGSYCIDTAIDSQFTSDYNVVTGNFGFDDNASYIDFATWKSAHNHDLHSIQAADTALFVNAAANDFRLAANSPAKDAGTALADVTDDITGLSRPQGSGFDIGCYELSSGGPADLLITTSSLPAGTVNIAYSQTVTASGGVTPYTWSLASGSLPAGLSLGGSTGIISGTPTTAGTSNFTVRVTDSQGTPDTDQKALSIVVNSAPQPLNITTTTLPNGSVGAAYAQTLQATGGVTPYTWSVLSGSLPAGLTLAPSTGTISGTPTTAATSNFTVRVTDSATPTHATDDQALSIIVTPADLVITTSSLPSGTQGAPYSQALAATGGTTPYTWSIGSGSLPAGLTLGASSGIISGTPTGTGTSNFTAHVVDSQGTPDTADKALSITVTSASGDPTYWQASSDTVSQTTNTTYQNKVTVTFTPTAVDDYIIIGYAEHSVAGYGSSTVRMTVDGAVEALQPRRTRGNDWFPLCGVKFATLSAASHTVAIDYAATGTDQVSIRNARVVAIRKSTLEWFTTSADSPQTVTTTPTTFATLNFTPSSAGDYLLIHAAELSTLYGTTSTVTAQLDAATLQSCPMQGKGYAGEAAPLATFSMATLTATPHAMTVQASIASGTTSIARCRLAAVRLTGGRFAGYAYAADDTESTTTSTTLVEKVSKTWTPAPTGNWLALMSASTTHSAQWYSCDAQMQFNAATISDNTQFMMDASEYLSTAGVGVVNVTGGSNKLASDYRSNTTSYAAKIKNAHLVMLPLDSGAAPLTVTTSSLAAGQISVAYSQTLAATGGTTPYTWSMDTGSLPSGLSLSSGGVISGTPTTAGTANFTVKVTDSATPTPATATKALSIYIPVDLSVTTSSVPNGQIGVAYSQTLAATGGVTPYSWSLASGSLPAGLSLSSGGVISGTPTTAGTSSFTARVTDSQAPADTATKALSITIPTDLSITTASLPNGQIAVFYSQTLVAAGGVTPYTWSLASGSLPAGLSLSSGGVISGTPTAAGTASFTVRVADSQTPNDTATKALSISIPADLSITTASVPNGQIGVAYSQTLAATGGVTPYTWSLASGSLPAGLSLSSGGVISGTPTTAATSNFTVQVADSQAPNDTATKALSITIPVDLSVTTASLPNGTVGVAYSQMLAAAGGVTPYSWSLSSGSLPAGLSLS